MKKYSFLVVTFSLMLLKHVVCGQTLTQKESFPSFDQIKPKFDEVIDYVNKSGKVEIGTINLFDYPWGGGAYIINGKSIIDTKYVKKIFFEKREYIDSLSLNQPNRADKRIIKIKKN